MHQSQMSRNMQPYHTCMHHTRSHVSVGHTKHELAHPLHGALHLLLGTGHLLYTHTIGDMSTVSDKFI